MKKYELFLFDADGTLYDFYKAAEAALETMFRRHGFYYDETVWPIYNEINERLWDSYDKGEIEKDNLKTLRFERLFNKLNISCDEENFNEEFLKEIGRGAFLIDGAYEICEKIHRSGKRIYIVTNGFLAVQESRFTHSPISEFISGFFVSEIVGHKKPDPEYFEYVFSNIPNADKSRTIIIGDSLTSDISGGINAGIDTCWFNAAGVYNTTNITPTYEIKKLLDIINYI